MADFCKDCSIELFGEDFKDLANIAMVDGVAYVLCEDCGYIWVNSKGEKVDMNAEKRDKILDLCGEIFAHASFNEPLLIDNEWVNSKDAFIIATKLMGILGYNKLSIANTISKKIDELFSIPGE